MPDRNDLIRKFFSSNKDDDDVEKSDPKNNGGESPVDETYDDLGDFQAGTGIFSDGLGDLDDIHLDESDTGPADFSVDFDFEGEYRNVPEQRPIKIRREKRTGCFSGIMYAIFVICVSLALAAVLWLAASDVLALGKADELQEVTIPRNYTIDTVADILHGEGLIKYKFLFKIYAKFSNADEKIAAGTYTVNTNFDYRALVNGMTEFGGERPVVSVAFPEGYTLSQMITLLVEKKVCTQTELVEAATNYKGFTYEFLDDSSLGDPKRLEGFLFPDTYDFYIGDSPERVFAKMLDNFDMKFTEEMRIRADELEYSIKDIVTVAAMIEREAGVDEERPTIASVIYNRLDSSEFPHLQIDATTFYALSEAGIEDFDLYIDSPYNTYVVEGLPIGPIANPGIESIRAALNPESTNYYYYALSKDGSHEFFRYYDSFDDFVNSDEYGG